MSTTKWLFVAHAHSQGNVADALRYLEAARYDDPEAGAALRVMQTKARKHSTAVRFEMQGAFVAFIDEPTTEQRIASAIVSIGTRADDLTARWNRIAEGLGA